MQIADPVGGMSGKAVQRCGEAAVVGEPVCKELQHLGNLGGVAGVEAETGHVQRRLMAHRQG
jgi:hypothetical protein